MRPERADYQALYCEENIWRLAQRPELAERAGKAYVALISNPGRRVALWSQRAGRAEDDGLVVWDYHVILVGASGSDSDSDSDSAARVWDLDSTLDFGGSADVYLRDTFRQVPPVFSPRFRLVDAEVYVAGFGSDRSHMRDGEGAYRSPPPPWPPPGGTALPLAQLLEPTALPQYAWADLASVRQRLRC